MLKIRFKDNSQNAVWLVEPKITIGRSATNALVIDDPLAGDIHMEILVDNESLTLRNLVPAQPIIVNGQEVTGACELKPGDKLKLGQVELIVVDPKREARVVAEDSANVTQLRTPKVTGWSLKANHTALANKIYPIKEVSVIGRGSECDICLAAAHLSRRHAQLSIIDGMLFVKDLDSANGTYLNGDRVAETRVKRGDELRFDALSFGVMGPAEDIAKTTLRKPAPVKAEVQDAKSHSGAASHSSSSSSAVPSTNHAAKAEHISAHQQAMLKRYEPEPKSSKGKYGVILLILLALAVGAAFLMTRK